MSVKQALRRQAALRSTYSKGSDLFWAHKATLDDVQVEEGVARLSGTVRGSGSAMYDVSLEFDHNKDHVASHSCTCPAAGKYAGVCKHCVALALAYVDQYPQPRRPRNAAAQTPAETRDGSAAASAPKPGKPAKPAKPKPPQASNRFLAEAIRAYAEDANALALAKRRAAELAAPPQENPAEFEVSVIPTSAYDYHLNRQAPGWQVKLRVSKGGAAYMVKDVRALVNAWEAGSDVTYGKNLAFAHVPSAFSKQANALLAALKLVVEEQDALVAAYRYGAYTGHRFGDFVVDDYQLICLLDALEGSSFALAPGRYARIGTYARTLAVVDADPDFSLDLQANPDGGYDLALPACLDAVFAAGRLYLLDNEHAWRCSEAFTREAGLFFATLAGETSPSATAGGKTRTAAEMTGKTVSLHLSDQDAPAFCNAVLPLLKRHVAVATPANLAELLPSPATFSFKISVSHNRVVCDAWATYGQAKVRLFEDAAKGQPPRDAEQELPAQEAVRGLFANGRTAPPSYVAGVPSAAGGHAGTRWGDPWSAYGYGYAGHETRPWFSLEDVDALERLLSVGVAELGTLGEVFLSDELADVCVRPAPSFRVSVGVAGGVLNLTVDTEGLSYADLMAYLNSYQRKQRYVRLSNGDILALGEGLGEISQLAAGLGVPVERLVAGQVEAPLNRTLFVDALLGGSNEVRFDRDQGFRAVVRAFDSVANADFALPANLEGVLRPYQDEGFRWLSTLDGVGFGGILADDMGLGKTLQLISYMASRKERADSVGRAAGEARGLSAGAENGGKPALVVCPASLVYNWMAELERFAPQLRSVAVLGEKAQRRAAIAEAPQADVLVTSYDLMKRDIAELEAQEFHCVALDEAQYIKNHATQAAKCAKRLRAQVRFALTGTPIENRLTELWSIFDFLMPGILGSREAFKARYEIPVSAGDETASHQLKCLVGPFILRRLKGDVLRDLPEKAESVVYARMSGEQEKLYRANEARLAMTLAKQVPEEFKRNKIAILAELTRLRQLCCDPALVYEDYASGSAKLETCAELVRSAVDGGHQLLLFSQFTSMLELIGERLAREGVRFATLTGSNSKEERVQLVERFQRGEVPVFLISLKAGGVGLNLTAADMVIHYDPWWNLAAQNQATDRAHRIGQTRSVTVLKLIAQNTIEERILEMQQSKRDLADAVLGGEEVGSSKLTKEDMLALLGAALEEE